MSLTDQMILTKCKCKTLSEIKNLNLWGSELQEIEIIKNLPNVEVISLSVNKISTLRPFGFCSKLSELYLRRNFIADLEEIKHLQNCKNLKILWLEENPVCLMENYRSFTIYTLQNLIKLDNVNILPSEREESINTYIKRNRQQQNSISYPYSNSFYSINGPENICTNTNSDNNNFNQNLNSNLNLNNLLENDYMSKIKNLDELTEFFTPNPNMNKNLNLKYNAYEKKDKIRKMHIPPHKNGKAFTFNDSLKGSENKKEDRIKERERDKYSHFSHSNINNIFIIKAIHNLLEELNPTQLKYLKRIIDRKLQGDQNSII